MNDQTYICTKCQHLFIDKTGPVRCPKCNFLYIEWVSYNERNYYNQENEETKAI